MKKLLITSILFLLCYSSKCQITLEQSYSYMNGHDAELTSILINHDIKYVLTHYTADFMNIDSIKIYNWNHSLYKSIPIVVCNNCGNSQNCSSVFSTYIFLQYVSDALFDTDSTTIDYMYSAIDTTTCQGGILEIRNENGTLLLHDDSLWAATVSPTTAGYKLIIRSEYETTRIFSLPGSLPCVACNGGSLEVRGVESPSLGNLFNYPNPTFDKTTIEYSFPQGINNGELVFYSLTGVEMKRFKVDRNFHDLQLSTRDLPAGTYFYQLQTASGSLAKKMIVIK